MQVFNFLDTKNTYNINIEALHAMNKAGANVQLSYSMRIPCPTGGLRLALHPIVTSRKTTL